jgi:uncharacterized phage protein gp47/JayE
MSADIAAPAPLLCCAAPFIVVAVMALRRSGVGNPAEESTWLAPLSRAWSPQVTERTALNIADGDFPAEHASSTDIRQASDAEDSGVLQPRVTCGDSGALALESRTGCG